MGEKQQDYRFSLNLWRKGHTPLSNNRGVLKSEDYDSDEDFCMAVASELMDMLQEDREYLTSLGD